MRYFLLLGLFVLAACAAPTPIIIKLTPPPGTATPTPSATPTSTLTPRPPTATRIQLPTSAPLGLATNAQPITPIGLSTPLPNRTAPAHSPVQAGTAVPQPAQPIAPGNVAQVGELARWGKGLVQAVAYASGGAAMRVQTSAGEFFYNPQTWAELRATAARQALFADPEALVLQGQTIQRASDGSVVSILANPDAWTLAVFSPDKQWLATSTGTAVVVIWDVTTGQKVQTLEATNPNGRCMGEVRTLAFSADSAWLVGGSVDYGCGYAWRLADGALVQAVDAQTWVVFGVAISPDKTRLVTVQTGGVVKVWQLPEGRLLYTRAHSDMLWWLEKAVVAFAPDGATFTVGLGNGEVLAYNTADGQLLTTLHAAVPTGQGVGFSANGAWLAVGAWDTVQVWHTATGLRLQQNPQLLRVVRYPAPSASQPRAGSGSHLYVLDVALAPDGQTVTFTLDNADDNNLFLWHISGQGLDTLTQPLATGRWTQLAFSPDSQWLAADADVYRVADWQLALGWALPSAVQNLAFGGAGSTLARLGTQGEVQVVRLTDHVLTLNTTFNPPLHTLALAPDGVTLALVTAQGFGTYTTDHFNFWVDVFPSEVAGTALTTVAFAPDGQLLATGNSEGLINLWRASDGQPLQTLSGHQGPIVSLAFSLDGRFLASGAEDGTVRLWGVGP